MIVELHICTHIHINILIHISIYIYICKSIYVECVYSNVCRERKRGTDMQSEKRYMEGDSESEMKHNVAM